MELQRHIENLRQRLGEVSEGFWLNTELQGYLNQGQRLVAQHVHSREQPYMTSMQWRTPVRSGAEFYLMEPDWMAINFVTFITSSGRPCPMIEKDLDWIRNNCYAGQYGSERYVFYQMKGRDRIYIAEGTVTEGSATQMTDSQANFANVRVGDIIFNLNDDNASAVITAVNQNSLTFQDWMGGVSHSFKVGEAYRIGQKERTRNQMWIYPVINFEEKRVHKGGNQFTTYVDNVFSTVKIQLYQAARDEAYNSTYPGWTVDSNIECTLYVDNNVLERYSIEGPIVGINNIADLQPAYVPAGQITFRLFEGTRELRPGTDYTLEVDGYDSRPNEFLQVDYTPYPRPMENARAICELEEFLYEPMYRKAKRLAWEKRDSDSPYLTTLDNEYDASIHAAKQLLRSRASVGPNRTQDRAANQRIDWVDMQGLTGMVGDPSDFM